MSEPQTSTAEILVHLVRPGTESQEVHLAEGSTVADLLRASGVSTTNQAILIDGVPIEEAMTLVDGVVITIEPESESSTSTAFWGKPITAFQDEQLCREYWEALEANRLKEVFEEQESSE